MNKIFKILLYIFPLVSMWMPENYFFINKIIGILFIIILFLNLSMYKDLKNNIFLIFLILFTFFIFMSILINGVSNLDNIGIAFKYLLPFSVASYVSINFTRKEILKLLKYYYYFWLILWLFKMIIFKFPLLGVVALRDEMWWDKSVVFGLFFSSFYFGFLLNNNKLTQSKKISKYIYAIPLFFIGARSITLGITIVYIIFIMYDLGLKLKNLKFYFVALISVVGFYIFYLFSYVTSNSVLISIFGSQRDQANLDNISLDTFSSGRTLIWQSYFSEFSFQNIIFGYGGINSNIGYSLHNDYLEILFFYGIFTCIIFIVFVYKFYIKPIIKPTSLINLVVCVFIIIQMLFNPFTVTLSSIYFFCILAVLYYDRKKYHEI